MSTKKSDLKSELADMLLDEKASESSISQALNNEAVTIGAPDETELLQRKHRKALEEQKNLEEKHQAEKQKKEEAAQGLDLESHRAVSVSSKKPALEESDSEYSGPKQEPKKDPDLLLEVEKELERKPLARIKKDPVPAAIAQSRIEQLETDIDGLRRDKEKLESQSSASRAQVDEMSKRIIEWEKRYQEMSERKDLDLQLAREELGHRTTKLEEVTKNLEELESRFEGEFHRIRVRERELQNRLEILKHENSATLRHKDELILDLKRELEKVNYEMEMFRKKNQGVYGQVEAQQDRMKRAMKALRVAVSLLDGADEKPLKKVE